MIWISLKVQAASLCGALWTMLLLKMEKRSIYVMLRGLTRVIWPPCFSVSRAVTQDGVCECGCEDRVSAAESTQQIAVGLNKRCTVEPCGSTGSFYRSHKEQIRKTWDMFTPVGQNMACCIRFQTVFSWSVVELGFICILKNIILF